MSYTATANLPTHRRGDTFSGYSWTFQLDGNPMDLTGATIKIEFRAGSKTGEVGLTLTELAGLTVVDNVVSIDDLIVSLAVGRWYYDVQITFPDGSVKTYVEGSWHIEQDVTQ